MVTIASVVVIIVAGVTMLWSVRSRSPAYNDALDRCLTARLAEEAVKVAGSQGEFVVYTLAGTEFESGGESMQLKFLRETLRRTSGITVTVETPTEYATRSRISSLLGLPDDVWHELVQKHSTAKAIISLIGPPRFPAEATAPSAPPTIALDYSTSPQWNELFTHPSLRAVIWSRHDESATATAAKDSCQGLFDTWFVVVTRDNAQQFQP